LCSDSSVFQTPEAPALYVYKELTADADSLFRTNCKETCDPIGGAKPNIFYNTLNERECASTCPPKFLLTETSVLQSETDYYSTTQTPKLIFFDLRSTQTRSDDAITNFTDDAMCRETCPDGYVFRESDLVCVKFCDINHATDKFRAFKSVTINGITSLRGVCTSACPAGERYYISISNGITE
jgi:hypothetical protein